MSQEAAGHREYSWPPNPVIYEINTWIWLQELGSQGGQPVTLGTVPQSELERLASYGFDGLWLMGVWQRSPAGRRVALEHPGLQAEYHHALPDYRPEDVVGSPYAVYHYQVDPALGSDAELAALRGRLRQLGLGLILDFVPNHLAIDHAWLAKHPGHLVQGDLADLEAHPEDYFQAQGRIFAHGRDPYFPGWTDTVQLDYRQPGLRRAMTDILLDLAGRCDGLRCDMAMLVARDVFLGTWGGAFDPPGADFWPEAIAALKARHPGFRLLAEVYWGMEYALQRMGFDYTYDKRLYDRLSGTDPNLVQEHLALASPDYQQRLVRFIENHDEPRARTTFGCRRSQAVATLALTLPGLRLLHEGQIEGRRFKLPVQLGRRPQESPQPDLEDFYRRLLTALREPVFHRGAWQPLQPRQAWSGNPTHRFFVAHCWTLNGQHGLVVANLAAKPSQCFLPMDLRGLAGHSWLLADILDRAKYLRDGDDLLVRGLYLDMPGCGYHLFRLSRTD